MNFHRSERIMNFKMYKCSDYNFVFPCDQSFLFREHFVHHLERHLESRREFSPLQRWCIHHTTDTPSSLQEWKDYYIKSSFENGYNVNCENCFPNLSSKEEFKMKRFYINILWYLWFEIFLNRNGVNYPRIVNEVKDISWEIVKQIICVSHEK